MTKNDPPTNAILAELARVRAVFQARAIAAVLDLPSTKEESKDDNRE